MALLITHTWAVKLITSWSNWPVVTLLVIIGLGIYLLYILRVYIPFLFVPFMTHQPACKV